MIEELVVLVDEQNNVLGTTPKQTVHGLSTALHRAFSAFIFNSKGEILLQQRSHLKQTWPLVWSNSCCGHPGPGESNIDTAKRRLSFELGLSVDFLEEVAPYRYSFSRFGVMENEICPIIVGFTDSLAIPNPDEVEAVEYKSWQEFLGEIRNDPDDKWSEWCKEEAEILVKNPRFLELYNLHTQKIF